MPLPLIPHTSTVTELPARYRQVAAFTYAHCREHFDRHGHWASALRAPDTRKTLWLCFGLLADTDNTAAIALGNTILEALAFKHHSRPRTAGEAASDFDIFISNHAVQMLTLHRERLSQPAQEKLEGWARLVLGDHPGDRQSDYQFHGANDNMPAKATLGLILGGEYFGDSEAIAHGKWNLRQLRDMLTRRGLISEYTSPTYLPLTLCNLHEIAIHSSDGEAAQLAEQCCERLWADILGHYHAPTRTVAGPYSRAYHLDSTGHFSTMNCLLWLALGDEYAAFNPLEELRREPVRLVHHHSDITTQLGVLAWFTACPLTPPAYLLQWALERRFPYHLCASAERIGTHAAEPQTTLYAEEDFALGSAWDEPWSSHQADVFFLQYRRTPAYCDITSLRTVFARYIFNDQHPPAHGEADLLASQATVHTLQHERIALLLARPEKRLSNTPVHTLRFSFVLSTHFGAPDNIVITRATAEDDNCADHVFIQDGPLYIALRGLNATRHHGSCESVTVETDGDYHLISFYNYKGPERLFSEQEILETQAGAVVVTGLAKEESFDAFRQRVLSAQLLDYYAFDQRTITYRLGATEISASYAPAPNRFRYATLNGQPFPRPRWQADGMPESHLPFLNAAHPTNPPQDFPYRHLKVIWDKERTWQIGAGVRKGFSLIELLTSIAVVAILAAILIPAIGRMHTVAQKTECIANLRTIFQAKSIYEAGTSNGMTMPSRVNGNISTYWPWLLSDIIEEIRMDNSSLQAVSKSPLLCSSVYEYGIDTAAPDRNRRYYDYTSGNKTVRSNYSVNIGIHPAANNTNWQGTQRPVGSLPAPSRTAIAVDGYNQFAFSYYTVQTFIYMHNDTMNVLFADGHVESLHKQDVPSAGADVFYSGNVQTYTTSP